MNEAISCSFSRAPSSSCASTCADRLEHHVPALQEERVEDLVLGGEVVVHEAIRHPRLVGDVGDAAGVEALAREHAHGGVEDHAPLVGAAFIASRRGARLAAHRVAPPGLAGEPPQLSHLPSQR